MKSSIAGLAVAAGLFGASALAQSPINTVYFLTDSGALGKVATTPGSVPSAALAITGVTAGDTLVAIDMRPQNQRLYALGVNEVANTLTIYHIAPETMAAAPVGGPVQFFAADGVTAVDLPVTDWDIDFNPTVDRLRVVSNSGLNFRMNPNTGAAVDGNATDPGVNMDGAINGSATGAGGAAYTNNQPNATVTTLYTQQTRFLSIQNPPNAGTQVSQTGFDSVPTPIAKGLDFAPAVNVGASNAALAAGTIYSAVGNGTITQLYAVNVADGTPQTIGELGAVRSIAVRTDVGASFALSGDSSKLVRFSTENAFTTTLVTITGITAGETLVGIDGRPRTGQMYGLGVNGSANTATLYLLDPQTGVATAVGAAGGIAFTTDGATPVDFPDTATVGYGMDFNPVVDRVRVVTGSGLNFRINPNTGAAVDGDNGGGAGIVAGTNPDGALNGGATGATATAYTNSFAGTTVTTQYSLDTSTGRLFVQNPPNTGTLTQVGGLTPFNYQQLGGFDIPSSVQVSPSGAVASGTGWVLAGNPGFVVLLRVDLATGLAGPATPFIGPDAKASGLTVWATIPELGVVAPSGAGLTNGTTVDLGSSIVNTPLVKSFTLNNGGSQGLTFRSALGTATQFVITGGGSGDLAGGTGSTLQVTFTPTVAGDFSDTITVTSNDPAVPAFTIPVSGAGLDPANIGVFDSSDVAIGNNGTLDFGATLVNSMTTSTLTITNDGDVPLDYSTNVPSGSAFSVTGGSTGSVAPGQTGTIGVTFTAGSVAETATDTLTITSNDPDQQSFTVNLRAVARIPLTNDVVVSTTGGTRFTPLANDVLAGDLTITSVSNPTIQISGRSLVIPAGFFGTFTYVVSSDLGTSGQASVTVTTVAGGFIAPTKLNGIIASLDGKITGWVSATISAAGKGTAKLITPAGKATVKLAFPEGTNIITTATKFGSLTMERNGDSSVSMTLGTDTAVLHVQSSLITAAKYHVALASIDSAIPGGGYAITTVSKKSAVKIVGLLPDGRPFSAGTSTADNGSIAFFAADVKKVNPKGYFGGELFPADLTKTDITGEIAWFKPGQSPKIKGLHLTGLDTTLTANGSLYTGAPLFTGNGTLDLSGGNLGVAESAAATISALGIPTTPLGSLKTWTGAKAKTGKFAVTVLVPTITKPVKGSGLYLPKSNSAWGFFPGTTVGGRIELSVQ